MADSSLKAPLSSSQQQIRRELLPKDWSAALVLDYLDKSEYGGELTTRTLAIGSAVYDLQVTVEGVALDVDLLGNTLSSHVGDNSAHGATGAIVGSQDFCSSSVGGVVFISATVPNAVSSTVSVTSPNASAAPAAYNQAQMAEVVALVNELKADLTQVVSDLNAAITTLNNSLASERAAKQRSL